MNDNLINFLSTFDVFDNDKALFLEIENFLVSNFYIRPFLVYSQNKNIKDSNIGKCRSVFGKNDRIKIYNENFINSLLENQKDYNTNCVKLTTDCCSYYYMKLGEKNNQIYFALFSAVEELDLNVLHILSAFSNSYLRLISKIEDLNKNQELIHIDDVTGLYNQRKLYKDLASLVEKYNKESESFSVLFVDLDYFKKVNDNFGHLVGTKLLEMVANDIKTLLRDTDFMYRYGGDEFVVILPGAVSGSGKLVGERILSKIKSKKYEFEKNNVLHNLDLSVSIGVADFPNDAKSSEEVLAIADRMMYEAKESGRGIVFNTQDVFRSAIKKAIASES